MSLRSVLSVVLCAALPVCAVSAQGAKPGSTPAPAAAPKPADAKADLFAVIQIGDKAPEVIHKSEIDAKKKALEDAFKKKSEDYEAAKKAAAAANKKFTDTAPVQETMKVLGDTFKTEAEAKAFIDKQKKDKEKPADKPKDKPAAKPKKGK